MMVIMIPWKQEGFLVDGYLLVRVRLFLPNPKQALSRFSRPTGDLPVDHQNTVEA
jgi:hypothetical protein